MAGVGGEGGLICCGQSNTDLPKAIAIGTAREESVFGFFGRDVTKEFNTVDLSDDLDDVEMLREFEDVFGIEMPEGDTKAIVTVGQFYDLIQEKLAQSPDFDAVWALTLQIIRAHTGTRDPIDRQTTFFQKHASRREPINTD